ncbi:Hypothetical predicted protein [Paramuricea clavata]|uniref:Uncharacterized protein n=1 Tax=Paramuricea clavata TaxID=317549 RepID=A0A7D9E7V7_PARCT|nr:Hypothetical predicted protein [Paramuricea clavata]
MNANNNENVESNSEDNLLDIINSSPFDKPNKKASIECVSATAESEFKIRTIRKGYAAETITTGNLRTRKTKKSSNTPNPDACLVILFISEEFTADVRKNYQEKKYKHQSDTAPGKVP